MLAAVAEGPPPGLTRLTLRSTLIRVEFHFLPTPPHRAHKKESHRSKLLPRVPFPPEFLSRVPEQSLLLSVRTAMEALRSLAEQLQPRLKGSGGFAPGIPHIMAAVLIARDSLGSRPACRAVPGVPESVHGRVNKLAARVRLLLKDEPQVPPPSAFVSPNVPPPPPSSAFIPSGPMPPRLIAQELSAVWTLCG